MHYRFFVLFDKSKATTSLEAREWVKDTLENAPGFLQADGEYNFSPSFADWFVIGGRWSGELTEAHLDQEKLKAFHQEFDNKKLGWINNSDKKEASQKSKTKKLFKKYFPEFTGEIPIYRDTYISLGNPDDAMIVDKKIYENILKQYEGEYKPPGEDEGIVNLDGDEILPETTVGLKWIVVVDYHM